MKTTRTRPSINYLNKPYSFVLLNNKLLATLHIDTLREG